MTRKAYKSNKKLLDNTKLVRKMIAKKQVNKIPKNIRLDDVVDDDMWKLMQQEIKRFDSL